MASFPGILAGARFLKEMPEPVFLGFMDAILNLVLPKTRYLKRMACEPGLETILILDVLFGFISGSAAGYGMPVLAFYNIIGLSGPLLLRTDAVIGLTNALIRSGTVKSFGLLTRDLVLLGIFMGLITIPGTWLAVSSRGWAHVHTTT